MDECDSGQTNTTHLWGFLLQRKSIQKRFPRQEKTSRKCENVDRLSPQGGDLVQMNPVDMVPFTVHSVQGKRSIADYGCKRVLLC